MNNEEKNIYIKSRLDLVSNNDVTDQLNYSNGILFHAVPDEVTATDLSNKDLIDRINKSLIDWAKNDVIFEKIKDGQIGLSSSNYSLLFTNGIIECFIPRIVKQTPINFPPKIRYIQVENVIDYSMDFINSLIDLTEKELYNKSCTIYITLNGIKGVVFNDTEKDYTTTKAYPKENLTFQINHPGDKNKEQIKESIEDAMDKTLFQYEPVI